MSAATTFVPPPSWQNGRPPVVFNIESNWERIFASFTLDHQVQEKYAEAILELKEEARSMLTIAKGKTISERIVLIDTLERLGVGYHFDQEIEDQLEDILTKFESGDEFGYDLFTTSLGFRILRQHHHYVSCSVFDKFIGQDKRFKETLTDDAKGLLSLYEAAHLRIDGEQILEEAVTFTVHHLKRMVQQLESPLQDLVKRALEHALHWGLPRMETRHYISSYEKDDSRNKQLLKLAKLDFNYVQNIYKNELHELTRWWNELNPHLPYVRYRVVACYLWALTFKFEPRYSYLLRWNIGETDHLPDYMKPIYKCVLKMYDEYEHEAVERGKPFAIPYAKQAMKDVCSAYNKGLKYTMGAPLPSFEDYIQMTIITSCIYVACSATFPGLKSVCDETIDWFKSEPKIIRHATEVCRYLDDVGSYDRERHEGALLTGLDFYMKYHGGTVQETIDKFIHLAEDAWINFNTEWIMNIKSSGVPKDVAEEILGYARVAYTSYKNGRDGFAKFHVMAPEVEGLFLEPIII
ncbi:Terpenoid synthase 17 [Striga hermonthica]|uniref:Terpenoid synthase 17 n=1 Tax=Striga hermonthica TaxID=68872 RepID=A0A9N7R1K3_STRHE|nr:Terpenoid synthase 17 [Striga hermonthica]